MYHHGKLRVTSWIYCSSQENDFFVLRLIPCLKDEFKNRHLLPRAVGRVKLLGVAIPALGRLMGENPEF